MAKTTKGTQAQREVTVGARRRSAQRVAIHITPAEAVEFANRLSYDDDFRAELQRDPVEVLSEYNIFLPPSAIPDDIVLPSKEVVRQAVGEAILDRDLELAAIPAFLAFVSFVAFFSK